MGLWLSKIASAIDNFTSGGPPARILMLGLDAAGKTTILYKMKLNETVATIPTIGFNVEEVSPCKGLTFTVWDVGGQEKIRCLWHHYYQNAEGEKGVEGLLYVVDSADRARLQESRHELFNIMEADEMRGKPVVVIANKQDLPNAMSCSELVDGLCLRKLEGRWYVQAAMAINGDGIAESMNELSNMVKDRRAGRRQ